MSKSNPASRKTRAAQISKALRRRSFLFLCVGIFSGVINLLALTGSIYMLQVYDRVIPSRSMSTLLGITLLMLGLYVVHGLLDMLRARIMSRIGLKFDKDVRADVFDIVMLMPLRARQRGTDLQPIRDLDQIRSFLATPGPIALFDMPWMPVFVLIIYWMHPWLGMLAIAGALILTTIAIITEAMSRKPIREAAMSSGRRHNLAEASRRNAEVVRAMGMGGRVKSLWLDESRHHLMDQRKSADVTGGFGSLSKGLRMVLQSAMLGLGAYLVILGEATPGVMIAGSILMSRALAPVETAIGHWRGFVGARQSLKRLKELFALIPDAVEPMQLPPPEKNLSVEGLWVAAPGLQSPIVRGVTFSLKAGAGLGIIGPSASGKSTLARALVGVWQPMPERGTVRLDGAALDQWVPEELGKHIGYLPQDIELFDGTIAQNIARFDPLMASAAIIKAALAAGVHDMILQMPQGYDTHIGEGGAALSAGQRQRVALARALYGDPFLVVLDEPNSNLDANGDKALAEAIRTVRGRGGIVIVIAHRPSVLAGLDELLAMAQGQQKAFGPKDEVLAQVTQQPPPRRPPGAPSQASRPPPTAGRQATNPQGISSPPSEFWTSAGAAVGTGAAGSTDGTTGSVNSDAKSAQSPPAASQMKAGISTPVVTLRSPQIKKLNRNSDED